MQELQNLYDRCESLPIPDKGEEEELDEQIFMVIDLETMIMAYAEASLKNIKPNFSLDGDNIEKLQRNVGRFQGLSESDQVVQRQLLEKLSVLKEIRNLLTQSAL